ncbi:hypothetical protein B0H14DRAFT_2640845 [Mycena olivaceomarginata]|nr:hypothetical protein B0H14DRAFT_2640845 [Mycena olivaceomarginata]
MATQAHINARIANASDYTLLSGTASVSVGGSLISRSDVPALSSKKASTARSASTPSIRIAYHRVTKTLSQSGFYTKSANYVFSQRITILNTKSIIIDCLNITDQIPMLQNAQIEVKLVNPALALPSGISSNLNLNHIIDMKESTHNAGAACRARVRGAADEPTDCVVEALGLDRKLNWVCSVGAQAKINLALE